MRARFERRIATVIRAMVVMSATAHMLSAQAMQRDILIGKVKGPKGDPIPGATVSVVVVRAAAGTAPQNARTDTEGRWLVAVQEGPGEYVVKVAAMGMKPAQDTGRRVGQGKPIVVDFRLEAMPVTLSEVKVVERKRALPPRENVVQDQASTEKFTGGYYGAIASADQGNLAAMAASVPGVQLVPDAIGGTPRFSMLGLSSDQNRVTLNGQSFGGGDIPRDAIGNVRVTATSYDVSRGGFSGGQLAIITPSGGNYSYRLAHVTLDAPTLQWSDAVARSLGQPYTNAQVSGAANGPIKYDSLFYNVSFQAGQRSSDLQSLVTGNPLALQRVGVAQDSVTRLVRALSLAGLPLAGGGVPGGRLTDNASVLGRIDWVPSADTRGNVVASLRYNRSRAAMLGVTAAPGHGGDLTTSGADVTATLSSYVRKHFLNDVRLSARTNSTLGDPYLSLPDVRIRVSSSFADGTAGVTSLQFGGNPALPSRTRSSGVELYDMFSWMSLNGKHRLRAMIDLRDDTYAQSLYPNRRGTYVFNSIADFEANHPAAFSRTFVGQDAVARVLSAALSIGEDWRPRDRVQFLYGVRIDANAFPNAPRYNPLIAARFQMRTDFAPRVVDVSPRFGFSRFFGTNGTTGIPGFGAPWGQIRGGIGLFRNDVAPTLIAPAMLASGLADGMQQISCIGAAVPIPDWSGFASDPSSIPGQCVGASATSPFASTRPNVWMVDRAFASQRSWRGSLALSGYLVPRLVRFSVEGIYSLNLHQRSILDLNFSPQQRFALAAEGNRPVYAKSASIVPATGELTGNDSRVDASFGRVTSLMTNLRSHSRQVIVSVFPFGGAQLGRFTQWNLSYVHQNVRDQARGFDQGTAGNPQQIDWARSAQDSRHQVVLSFWTRVRTLMSISTQASLRSGVPFTPMVGGDINGDGFSNDRAFVFSPSAAADPVVRAGMASVLAGASSRVRQCLQRQIGRVAARNSCEGPWTSSMNAALILNPQLLGFENRMQVMLSLTNVTAGLDALLHRSTHLQGWGQPATVDPSLLLVRGFDAASGAYRYEVNPRFGDTRVSRVGIRTPFLVTLEARVMLGRLPLTQQVTQTVAVGRTQAGTKLTLPQMKIRLLGAVFNPIRQLLLAKDSLSILTNDQLKQLTLLDRQVTARQDSIVTPVAQYLVNLPNTYDVEEAKTRVFAMQIALFDAVVDGMRTAGQIFTAEQINEFPPALTASFNIKRLLTTRPVRGFYPNY